MLDPDVWRGLSLADYNLWASEIWNILALRACRRYVPPVRDKGTSNWAPNEL